MSSPGTIWQLLLGAPWPLRAEGEPAPAEPILVPTSRTTTGCMWGAGAAEQFVMIALGGVSALQPPPHT